MLSLIQAQSIRFENHNSGTNEPIRWETGLHMHKVMNKDRYNGVEILLSLDTTNILKFRKIKGKTEEIRAHLVNEINTAFKKDKNKSRVLIKAALDAISKYSLDLPFDKKIENLRNGALRIAKSFGLNSGIKENILNMTNNYIKNYISFPMDESGNEYFIIQDIEGNCIKIGNDLNILINEEIKLKE